MAPIRQSNVERRKVSDECRRDLSEHIRNRLGIIVKPSKVHLIPNANDAYLWKVLPGKEEFFSRLFSKNLSDHSMSAHKELSKGVGVIFEAIPATNYTENTPDRITSLHPEPSFSAKISKLEEQNNKLLQQLHECQGNVVIESEHRRVLEQEVHQLYGTQQRLQEQVQHYAVTADFFKSNVSKYFQGLDKVLPMLEELRSGLSLGIPK